MSDLPVQLHLKNLESRNVEQDQSSAIAERPARRSVLVELLSYCCT